MFVSRDRRIWDEGVWDRGRGGHRGAKAEDSLCLLLCGVRWCLVVEVEEDGSEASSIRFASSRRFPH